jgi:TetR/AcrR family transcriptional regulator, mexJK operon transcriptional repressor
LFDVPLRIGSTRPGAKQKAGQAGIRLEKERLENLLDVAEEVFIAEGFSAASTSEMARRANCSKATLYSRFPAKEDLLTAVIERCMTRVFGDIAGALPADASLEETLRDFGARLLQVWLSPDQVALVRVINTESGRFPALGQRFFETGPGFGQAVLAEYFAGQVQRGRLLNENPQRMAEHYMSLLCGGAVRWASLGQRPLRLKADARTDHLEAALRMFLRAYAKTSP